MGFDVCYLEQVPFSCIAIEFGNTMSLNIVLLNIVLLNRVLLNIVLLNRVLLNTMLFNIDYTVKFNGMRTSHFQILAVVISKP